MKTTAKTIFAALVGKEQEAKAAVQILREIDLVHEVRYCLQQAMSEAAAFEEREAEYEEIRDLLADSEALARFIGEVKDEAIAALPERVTHPLETIEQAWGHSYEEWAPLGSIDRPADDTPVIFSLDAETLEYRWEIAGVTQEGTHPAADVLSW